MTTLDAGSMAQPLAAWARAHRRPDATVRDVAPMPGNAGLSFGFRVEVPDAPDAPSERLVVRLAPPGVRRRGNTDVLRQVPLLDALDAGGVPVAPVLWSTDDPAWFGTDALVQPYLDALPVPMHLAPGERAPSEDLVHARLRAAVDALAVLHAVDPGSPGHDLTGWSEPVTAASEVAFWGRLLERSPDADLVELGRRLGAELVESDPGGHRTGVFHGDFQTHNVLYAADGALAAVIDWEIAGLGPVGLDLGWLQMMVDPACWHAERRAVLATPCDPAVLEEWYAAATGRPVEHAAWYRAWACFRYGAIAASNLHLHTSGRRPDEVSVLMGGGCADLFRAGLRLVAEH